LIYSIPKHILIHFFYYDSEYTSKANCKAVNGLNIFTSTYSNVPALVANGSIPYDFDTCVAAGSASYVSYSCVGKYRVIMFATTTVTK